MTTSILVNVTGVDSSKAFENKVAKLINTELSIYRKLDEAKEIYISDAGMGRGNGRGSYNKLVTIKVDGEEFNLKMHTNDSPAFDYYTDCEMNRTFSNWMKVLILEVITERIDDIGERLTELLEEIA